MSSFLDMSTDPNLKCGLFDFGVFRPECWAQVYQQQVYGTIPAPTAPIVDSGTGHAPGTPLAPQTADQMTDPAAWTPDAATAGIVQQYGDTLRQQIQDAINNGTYNPAGNSLSNFLQWWSEYGTYALAGAGILLALVVAKKL